MDLITKVQPDRLMPVRQAHRDINARVFKINEENHSSAPIIILSNKQTFN